MQEVDGIVKYEEPFKIRASQDQGKSRLGQVKIRAGQDKGGQVKIRAGKSRSGQVEIRASQD